MPTLHTVTLNTGYDDHFHVAGLTAGGVGRVTQFGSVPAGKGVNCARTARGLGLEVVVHALIGEDDRDDFARRLVDEGLDARLVGVPGGTRHNLTLWSEDAVASHAVGPGFTLGDDGPARQLIDTIVSAVRPGDVVTLNGSISQGLPDTIWAHAAHRAIERGARVVVDAQGAAFVAALQVTGLTACKPNEDEVLALTGVTGADDPVTAGLQVMAEAGVAMPIVSLGSGGAAFLADGAVRRLACPVDRPMQAVAAGDAFVAGLVAGLLGGEDTDGCVGWALAVAAAHVAGASVPDLPRAWRQNLTRVHEV